MVSVLENFHCTYMCNDCYSKEVNGMVKISNDMTEQLWGSYTVVVCCECPSCYAVVFILFASSFATFSLA